MPKISELTTVTSPISTDVIPLVEGGVTKKATLASLPISDAEVTALALKAPLASPTFTGTATIPTLALTNDLAVTEGGTGASTAGDARTNLGLGTIATQAANSVAITGGAVTGITDITVADGGTGASTAADARTNLGIDGAIQALSLGQGQTWQNLSASRALATTYTNSTARPIAVSATVRADGAPAGSFGAIPTIAGASQPYSLIYSAGIGYISKEFFIVPPGSTYSVGTAGSASSVLDAWFELR
jgi:hypothetical protein